METNNAVPARPKKETVVTAIRHGESNAQAARKRKWRGGVTA